MTTLEETSKACESFVLGHSPGVIALRLYINIHNWHATELDWLANARSVGNILMEEQAKPRVLALSAIEENRNNNRFLADSPP